MTSEREQFNEIRKIKIRTIFEMNLNKPKQTFGKQFGIFPHETIAVDYETAEKMHDNMFGVDRIGLVSFCVQIEFAQRFDIKFERVVIVFFVAATSRRIEFVFELFVV